MCFEGSGFADLTKSLPGQQSEQWDVVATYIASSPPGNRYTASGCAVTTPNEAICCKTVAGIGAKLAWSFSLSVPPAASIVGTGLPAAARVS